MTRDWLVYLLLLEYFLLHFGKLECLFWSMFELINTASQVRYIVQMFAFYHHCVAFSSGSLDYTSSGE